MGLFGKAKPVEPLTIRRQDMAAAIAGAPAKEIEWLKEALPEIEFLSNALPADEQIISAAYCCKATTLDYTNGVIAFSEKRIVAVIGSRQNNPGSAPTVYVFPFADLSGFSYAPGIINFGYFDLKGQERITLEIGKDKVWPSRFMDAAKQQFNRSKF